MMTLLVSTEVFDFSRTRDQAKSLRDASFYRINTTETLKKKRNENWDSRSFAEEDSRFNLFSNLNGKQFLIQYDNIIVTSSSQSLVQAETIISLFKSVCCNGRTKCWNSHPIQWHPPVPVYYPVSSISLLYLNGTGKYYIVVNTSFIVV